MTKGKITSIISNLLTINVDGPVGQNEICYVKHNDVELRSEVIKVFGDTVYAQVFESTSGVKIGSEVNFTGSMLEIELGPGLLSKNYDGLQNDLNKMESIYLKRGEYTYALDDAVYEFAPTAKVGDQVTGGDWIGEVSEKWINHKIMVPFAFTAYGKIKSIAKKGPYTNKDVIAVIETDTEELEVKMSQKWPVKVPIRNYKNKPRPFKILETGQRAIDTLNPITEGGTGFIPGPFGAGKTVLQHAIAKNGEADLVLFTACGERANEVVEIFKEFPELVDTRTGRKLAERTTIICNTSNMPVAAREASVYVGMTIAEYYRAMGLKVLLLADSTSRWAQALREMSNRLEELPGPDAFPMDLTAIISNFYSRAGFVHLNNGETGSVTFIGTVSPAGGNLKEPVTESTRKAARCFYALAQGRADSKRYPAIEPVDSYSKYLEYDEFIDYSNENISQNWVEKVNQTKDIVLKGREAADQISILGDDAVPLDYHQQFWKSEVIDFVILQQDAFDKIDMNCPIERQVYMLEYVLRFCNESLDFEAFEEISEFYKKAINLMKQMNYSEFNSKEFKKYEQEMEHKIKERRTEY
ncbi:MAG: V-type ATP synthase subunit A [Cytophagales bacterium]|nr:V-type ATP synthase subunit A [Cytophagales bacterium]